MNKRTYNTRHFRQVDPGRAAASSVVESLEDRTLLSGTLAISSNGPLGGGLLVFNAVKNSSASPTLTVTVTNHGASSVPLGKGGLSIVSDAGDTAYGGTEEPSRFAIVNSAALPPTLGAGKSAGIQVHFTANAVGRFGAELRIGNPASPAAVILHGIGTSGLGGSNEPSLARILLAYDIPTIVGEGHDDANEANSIYPEFPDPTSQEVAMQVLQKAGPEPVTITDLADFTDDALQPAYGIGYYTPNQPSRRTQLFTINDSDAQSVDPHPVGSTSFDPGSSKFGLYFESSIKDKGQRRLGYSQDIYNTWDTTQKHKFRFFPMKNANGSVVANTYIVTTTEFNAPIGYNFHNIVAIIRNVKPG